MMKRSMVHMCNSLYDATTCMNQDYITVTDDKNDASQYGYRIFIPYSYSSTTNITPQTRAITNNISSVSSSRHSSSSSLCHHNNKSKKRNYHNHNMHHHRMTTTTTMSTMCNTTNTSNSQGTTDDYSHYMNVIDPNSLDILSSPEVLAIMESQHEWDVASHENDCNNNNNTNDVDDDNDPYLSDCETMKDEHWNHHNSYPSTATTTRIETFETLPSLDEKRM